MIFSIFSNKRQKIQDSAKQLYEELLRIWKDRADNYVNVSNMSDEEKLSLLEKMVGRSAGSSNMVIQDTHENLSRANLKDFDKEIKAMNHGVMGEIKDILDMNNTYVRLCERYKREDHILESVIEDWHEYLRMITIIECGGENLADVEVENEQLDVMRMQSDAATKKDELKKRLKKLLKKNG